MAETTKTDPREALNNTKITLILVIVFGSVSVLLLAYIALRVTIGPHLQGPKPGIQNQLQQRRLQRGSVQPQNQNPTGADPLNFNEEMNVN